MFIHSVYFWLKPSLPAGETEQFRRGLESLKDVPALRALYVGTPMPGTRPVVDASYNFALVTVFDDPTGHDAYQVHPLHKAFLERFRADWERILVYDAQ